METAAPDTPTRAVGTVSGSLTLLMPCRGAARADNARVSGDLTPAEEHP